jgi:hypothetical protein
VVVRGGGVGWGVCGAACVCVDTGTATEGCKGVSSKQWELGGWGGGCEVVLVMYVGQGRGEEDSSSPSSNSRGCGRRGMQHTQPLSE